MDICKQEMLKEICSLNCRLIEVNFCPKNPDIRKSIVLFLWGFRVFARLYLC